jgi:hypothetical protein
MSVDAETGGRACGRASVHTAGGETRTAPMTPPDTDCVALSVAAGNTVTLRRLDDEDGVVCEATATGNFRGVVENRQAGQSPQAWIAVPGALMSGNTVRS